MRFLRGKESGTTDPQGRRREADAAIGQALGLPGLAVRPVTSILYGPVSDDVCRLLPGAERSTAARLLILLSAAAAKMPVDAARARRRDLAEGHATAAALPGMMLFAVTSELLRRYDVANPQAPYARHHDAAPPEPTSALREVRRRLSEAPVVHPVARAAGRAAAQAAHAATPDLLTRAWGAWATVAVVAALNDHQHELPEPGRARERPAGKRAGAADAGFAYQVGREALAAAAIFPPE